MDGRLASLPDDVGMEKMSFLFWLSGSLVFLVNVVWSMEYIQNEWGGVKSRVD